MNLDKIIAVRTGKTVYKDYDRVIKVFDSDYSKTDILNEALNQARAEEAGLSVPRLYGVEKEDGKWAIVSEYISGKTVAEIIAENPDKADEIVKRFAEIQIELQKNASLPFTRLKDKVERRIKHSDVDDKTRARLLKMLSDFPEGHCLCHCDFSPTNVIIDKSGNPVVIDWSHAAIGAAEADAASAYLRYLFIDKTTAEKYLDFYCECAGKSKESIIKLIPIMAAAKSVSRYASERSFLLGLAVI